MSIPIRSPITAQTALRKIAAQASAAPERGAIPNNAAAGYEYGAAMADKALEAKKIESMETLGTQRLNLGAAELAEKSRQFDAGLAQARDYMDQWEKQNKWATVIGVGNLAAQGLGMYAQDKSIKAQTLRTEGILKGNREMVDAMKTSQEKIAADWKNAEESKIPTLRDISRTKKWTYTPAWEEEQKQFQYIN